MIKLITKMVDEPLPTSFKKKYLVRLADSRNERQFVENLNYLDFAFAKTWHQIIHSNERYS